MSERERPPPAASPVSPASRRAQTLIAVAFVAVWLTAALIDFFAHAAEPVLPIWFHALGILALGFVLGLNFPAAADRLRR